MTHLEEYLRRVEEVDIPKLREDLAPLESGEMRLASQKSGGPWVDETDDWIKKIKGSIDTYEKIAAALRKKLNEGT